jgi:hypothetical protein
MTELDYITKEELLQQYVREVKHIAKTQFIEIDNDYNLIKDGETYTPDVKITESISVLMVTIKYNTIPLTEMFLTKPKWIERDKMIYSFKEVI